jgi:hypothetical protein
LALDSSDVAYYSFDFHRLCGQRRHHEKIQELIDEKLINAINSIGFCWMDKNGHVVLRQKGVIRTVRIKNYLFI